MKKYQPLTNATLILLSVLVYIYLHCIHILLQCILLYFALFAFLYFFQLHYI